MMRKYFVISDVHSFYNEMMKALEEVSFDINNPNHIFVSCGDLLDRGKSPVECLKFINELPKERKILVRGNHEDLLEECLARHMFGWHDYHNGTAETIDLIADYERKINNNDIGIFGLCKNSELLNTYLDSLVDYGKVGNNIFVHGWLPWYRDADNELKYNIEESGNNGWSQARWENGMEQWNDYGYDPNYTVFCGHYHSSYGHSRIHSLGDEWGENSHFEPFIDKGIVALDACTAYSGKVNCYVFDNNK